MKQQRWPHMWIVIMGFGFVLLSGCAGPGVTHEEKSSVTPGISLIGTFQVQRFLLKNGLRLLVVEDHSSPTFAYQTWYRVGSRNEEVGRTGLAHLFEHMMFKGTKDLKEGEFDRILESAGAEGGNAFTSRDYTVYVQELPTAQLDLIARLEADRMRNLIVNERSFKTEREVVQNERRFRNENSPDGLMYQELFGIAFTQHPYHWPVIGYQEDLERMSAEDAVQFYNSHYSPDHATVIVVGDVKPEQALDVVTRYYGSLEAQQTPEKSVTQEPEQTAPRRKNLKLNIQVEKLLVGYPIPAVTHADIPAIDVLDSVLAGGKSSRLHRALVETGIASSVESYGIDDKDPSVLVITANLQTGKKAAQAESVILKELGRLAKEPISAKELERAKNRMSFGFLESLNSSTGKAHFLGKYETIASTFEEGLKAFYDAQKVNATEVQAVVKRYFDPKRRSVITGVPK